MKNALIRMTAFLLVLLLLAGCSSGSPRETQKDPAKKTQASSETKKSTDSTKNETKSEETDKPTDSAKNESKPAETEETESKENPAEETKEETPADLYMKAVRINEETHYGEQGAYGFFTHVLMKDPPPYTMLKEQVFLYFSDRQYNLQYDRDNGKVTGASLHTDGNNWITTYFYYPTLPAKVLNTTDKISNVANVYYIGSLSTYSDEIKEAPEQVEYNGVPCWRFTATASATSTYPEGSADRTWILFRQEDLIYVYTRRDVVTPDGTEIPIAERHVLSEKETEEFYQTHAQDFADAEKRDSGGNWTLTMVFDPGKKNERTFQVPMNADEDMEFNIRTYTPYLDREGTKKINLEIGSADIETLMSNATDTTIYLIGK